MSGHIVAVGNLNMDMVVRTERHPDVGDSIQGIEFRSFPGGKGGNQAVAAARLLAPVKMIGRVGTDAFGDQLLQSLKENSVDVSFVCRDATTSTGVALVTVDYQGQETIITIAGANQNLCPEDIEQAEAAFVDAKLLLLQLGIPRETARKAVDLAQKYQLPVIANPSVEELDPKIISKINTLVLNHTELGLLTGIDSISSAASCLIGLGIPHLIVTLGQDGAVLKERNREVFLPGYSVPVIDATGAGDAFLGAFAAALLEGFSYRVSAVWGNAAGALAVTRTGAQPSLPTRVELADFLEEKF